MVARALAPWPNCGVRVAVMLHGRISGHSLLYVCLLSLGLHYARMHGHSTGPHGPSLPNITVSK